MCYMAQTLLNNTSQETGSEPRKITGGIVELPGCEETYSEEAALSQGKPKREMLRWTGWSLDKSVCHTGQSGEDAEKEICLGQWE